jgi:hypothetical protein
MSTVFQVRAALSACYFAALSLSWSPVAAAEDELTVPPNGVLDFAVIRKGEVIGTYRSEFSRPNDGVIDVRTRIKVQVTVGPIRLYSFDHTSAETWRSGRLVELVADTDDDGDVHHLEARGAESKLVLTVDGKSVTTEGDSVPSSLWTMAMLTGGRPIFDITDGELFKTTVRCDPVPSPTGSVATCEVTGGLVRSLHYGANGVLEGLSFLADDGSFVVYRRR